MQIKVTIKGEGSVNGDGQYQIGDTATITSIPDSGMKFGYFQRGEQKIYSTNYTIKIESEDDIEVIAYFYMTMRDYLTADFEYAIKDSALSKIASKRGFRLSDDSNDPGKVTEKQKALAEADILITICNSPSTIQGRSEKAGNWSETEGSRTLSINDKKRLEDRAKSIYAEWGEVQSLGVTVRISRKRW